MKKGRFSLTLLIGVALFTAAGCGSGGEVKIGDTDDGGQVPLEVGQTLVLSLDSNPTTGYQWEITELDEAILKQTGHEYEADQPVLIGSGGKEVWRFQAQSSGSTTLSLGYKRSWEEGIEPIQTYSVEVAVR